MEDEPVVMGKAKKSAIMALAPRNAAGCPCRPNSGSQSHQQVPLKLNGERPIRYIHPGHMKQVVQVAEMEQQVASRHRHVRDMKHRTSTKFVARMVIAIDARYGGYKRTLRFSRNLG